MTWNWNYVVESLPAIFQGMWITLGLTIACYLFAMLFGFVWTFVRRIPWRPLQMAVAFIMEFIRSTPPLVQLFFLYYAWPMVPYVGLTLDPITVAIIGLGVHFSTYIAEIYRSGIESIDKGQWEAATALNLSLKDKWTKIILPQAIPPTIPMLGNYLIIMFKEVPLTSTIGVAGMLHAANNFGSKNFAYLEPLTLVALFFLVMSYPTAVLFRKLEQRMNRRFDKNNPTGKIDKGVVT
ncbi:ectoine/hydroxyectoine ABC transporter permease subunit EhuD [Sediminibacillus dalangtanensis]|uniref:Ectoine/hydroxyectoine ABC transporter permease subunit EhuD n=1 Tax=Sediminibacillus dalangtanensis TaxID=2729421 RepID=A0ABX7VVG7_9BACI|nr:ectoine/hydroxyectoine ABC transporter permease subunit EhuD [Sediminibacillus dalangtanensis]QTN00942.1 ectoine/hydroxyectoine ABC transporter permease subunit EhuD [Sediminibacillus dalangtanensis]